MAEEGVISESLIDPIEPATPPAPGAEEQKPNTPASDADDKTPETPEQQAAKQESRRAGQRARQRARQAAELAAAQTEARMLREQLAQKQQPESGEPTRDKFEDYESFIEARAEWRAEQAVEKRLEAERKANQGREQQSRANASQAEIAKKWTDSETAFKTANPDYDEVVTPYAEEDLGQLSDPARRFILEAGPALLHHLALHSDVHERIAALSPIRQVAELGKLESAPTPVTKKASNAPAPIKPVGQGRSASNGFSENDSQAEYEAKRRSQGARWAR